MVVDFAGESVGFAADVNVLDARSGVGEDFVAYVEFVHEGNSEDVDVVDFAGVFGWVDGEEAGPPLGFFGVAREREGFFQGDFSFHGWLLACLLYVYMYDAPLLGERESWEEVVGSNLVVG